MFNYLCGGKKTFAKDNLGGNSFVAKYFVNKFKLKFAFGGGLNPRVFFWSVLSLIIKGTSSLKKVSRGLY